MPDNWTFVFAAYGVAALLLGGYWRSLQKRERESTQLPAARRTASRAARPAHPRANPSSPPPSP